ncbi:DUF4280 domain-containing protein [Thermomonas sp. S9]|jgi:hypothetical protein|uniref:DUF4280 domain-containing protein n=1 Tax=Thermomonas sp. S9 TaxID=2885203 RepID=UPI001AC4CA80|nr:DUF4280 domain-containing protein [Thermomonas sp. S9]MBN8716878.1 DUF4280 domain-containing protein [Xanthomonadales bacterium]MBN8795117.1 DUF4280 domain-containing protein [Stenotrophomonas nitritireducens]MCR6496636.1 DUF4280 domain-containing protein [Thermomonas sp. S9]
MPIQVVNGASLMCPFGVAPSTLVVTPENRVLSGSQPAATIMDCVPMKNIMPFGMCTTPSNPQVAAATAAAMGVLTPQPCIPATTPWKPGATTVLIGGIPALDNTCTCQCAWGGVITVVMPGQMTEMIP